MGFPDVIMPGMYLYRMVEINVHYHILLILDSLFWDSGFFLYNQMTVILVKEEKGTD